MLHAKEPVRSQDSSVTLLNYLGFGLFEEHPWEQGKDTKQVPAVSVWCHRKRVKWPLEIHHFSLQNSGVLAVVQPIRIFSITPLITVALLHIYVCYFYKLRWHPSHVKPKILLQKLLDQKLQQNDSYIWKNGTPAKPKILPQKLLDKNQQQNDCYIVKNRTLQWSEYQLFWNCLLQQKVEGKEIAGPGWKYTDLSLSEHKIYKWNHVLCATHSRKTSPSCHLK